MLKRKLYVYVLLFIVLYLFVGYHLYFGIGEQKQILIIESRFIVFQKISH